MSLRSAILPTLLGAAWLTLIAPTSALAEAAVSTTYRVFEKAVKMKRIEATLLLPYDAPGGGSAATGVDCAVAATGRRGDLAPTGRLLLRLEGVERGSGAPWQGSLLPADLDAVGVASFDGAALDELDAEAQAAGADVEIVRVDYAGGRGKRVDVFAVSCGRQPGDE